MRHKMIRMSFGAIALGCIAFFMIGITQADANHWGFPNKGLCTMVGTWQGEDPMGGMIWFSVYTPGRNAINGQATGEFVLIDPTLGLSEYFPVFADAVRVTNPVGVWKKVGWRRYQFTTRAYGLDQYGEVIYTWRVSGETELLDCDHSESTSVTELWLAGDDISTDPPLLCFPGTAVETRVPLVQASCEY
jgi:hypothetical protein